MVYTCSAPPKKCLVVCVCVCVEACPPVVFSNALVRILVAPLCQRGHWRLSALQVESFPAWTATCREDEEGCTKNGLLLGCGDGLGMGKRAPGAR